jgi:WD40 repeat protein
LRGTLGIFVACLVGCANQPTFQSPLVSPLQPPGNLAAPTTVPPTKVVPTETPQPTATKTATAEPSLTPTSAPSPEPTATYPPYAGTPFTITFIRDGNLWLSEIGETGERQLTHESNDWPVVEYATAPSCDRIAYIPYQGPPNANALIKGVNLSNGTITALTGEHDPYIEYGIGWLDKDHIMFAVSEFAAPGYAKDPAIWAEIQPFHHIVLDLVTGKRTFVPESLHLSQSPDGQYWLTCSMYYVYEGDCKYKLLDRATNQQGSVANNKGWGSLLAWSPDSQEMLFSAYDHPGDETTRLEIVGVATRKERFFTPSDKTVTAAAWSPNSHSIAYNECRYDERGFRENCALQVTNRNGTDTRTILADTSPEILGTLTNIAWIPDGSRLIFLSGDRSFTVWSINNDGTDLRPIVSNAGSPQVLCKP